MQVEQLKLQKDVLQKLRESEGRRRSEAANEGVLLRERIEKQEEEIEKLYEVGEMLLKQKKLQFLLIVHKKSFRNLGNALKTKAL